MRFLEGADRNFKVTTPTDVKLAGFLLTSEVNDDEVRDDHRRLARHRPAYRRKFLHSDNGVTDVVLVARESADFTNNAAALRENNPLDKKIHTYEVDLGDRALAVGLVKDVIHRVGQVDILINNAGFTAPAAIQQIAFSDFEQTIGVNLYAPFTTSRSCCAPATRSRP